MYSSLITNVILFFSFCHLAIAASAPQLSGAKLTTRQAAGQPAGADACLDYEFTANMSTIGANGSYRTVLLQKSNVGTIYNARMMDAAIVKLPALTADEALNQQCGNWTEIALREAELNFTKGIVAQFTTEGLPVGIKAGPEVGVIVTVIVFLFAGVWIFSA